MIFMEVQNVELVHLAARFQNDKHAEHSKQLPSARLLNELECLLEMGWNHHLDMHSTNDLCQFSTTSPNKKALETRYSTFWMSFIAIAEGNNTWGSGWVHVFLKDYTEGDLFEKKYIPQTHPKTNMAMEDHNFC